MNPVLVRNEFQDRALESIRQSNVATWDAWIELLESTLSQMGTQKRQVLESFSLKQGTDRQHFVRMWASLDENDLFNRMCLIAQAYIDYYLDELRNYEPAVQQLLDALDADS